jgi:hypothetical protein
MAYPPPFGRGRGNSHTYGYSPYVRSRAATRDTTASSPPTKGAKLDLPHPRFEIDGATFELVNNGSKLRRITCRHRVNHSGRECLCITALEGHAPTPSKHQIAGIKFFRTKGGNLLRHKEYMALEEKKYYGTTSRRFGYSYS